MNINKHVNGVYYHSLYLQIRSISHFSIVLLIIVSFYLY